MRTEGLAPFACVQSGRLGENWEKQDAEETGRQVVDLERFLPSICGGVPVESCDSGVETGDVEAGQLGVAACGEGTDAAYIQRSSVTG